MKMHTAPNPGPPVGKPHDVSFDKEKTLMRTISTEGEGEEAREGSVVVVHVDIAQPDSEGKLKRMYCSRDTYPDGVRFELGRSFYSEALERSLYFCKPGSVIDTLCTDPDQAADHTLNVFADKLPEGARPMWCAPNGPIGIPQGAMKDAPMIAPKEEDTEPPWQPSQYAMVFHILLDSVSMGQIPMYMEGGERLNWVTERKAWATELFKRGWYARAMRHYKKAMLDLEVPIEWYLESQVVERNQLRTSLHLNVAACGVKLPFARPYPNLQTPKMHTHPQRDAIRHCTRVLKVDPKNVKAYYRRAMASLTMPEDQNINGLADAIADLKIALEFDPENVEVRREMKRAKERQRVTDKKASGMYTKMIGTGIEV